MWRWRDGSSRAVDDGGGGCRKQHQHQQQHQQHQHQQQRGTPPWLPLLLLIIQCITTLTIPVLATSSHHPPSLIPHLTVDRILLHRSSPSHSVPPSHLPPTSISNPDDDAETRSYDVALFGIEIEQAKEIRTRIDGEDASLPLSSTRVHGLTRLVCSSPTPSPRGGDVFLFESHPSPHRHAHAFHVKSAEQKAKEKERERRRVMEGGGARAEQARKEAAGMSTDEEGDGLRDEGESFALQAGPPIYLVPLHGYEMEQALRGAHVDGEEAMHPLYRLLAATRVPHQQPPNASSTMLEFALVTSYMYGALSSRRHIISPRDLRHCEMIFLPRRAQTHHLLRGGGGHGEDDEDHHQPPANYVAIRTSVDEGTDIVRVEEESLEGQRIAFSNRKRRPTRRSAFKTRHHDELPQNTLNHAWSILRHFVYAPDSIDAWPTTASSIGSLSDRSRQFDPSLLNSPQCRFDRDSPVVFLESDAAVYGTVASQARNMMVGLLAPATSAVAGGFQSTIGGMVLAGAKEFLPPGVADGVTDQLTRQLPPMITRLIIPAIGASVSASLPPATVSKISPYAAHGISYKTVSDIVDETTINLVRYIHRLVDVEMPESLALLSGAFIPHLLSRSVTHSTVAALTHALEHSPLHESFCSVCRDSNKMCEFCHFNANKAFYGLYYAGYFSTYYSAYYQNSFLTYTAQHRVRALQKAQGLIQDQLRYTRIDSDKGDERSHWLAGRGYTGV